MVNSPACYLLVVAFIHACMQVTEGGKKGVIMACEAGGTLRASTNFSFGKASRSLQGAYRYGEERVTQKTVMQIRQMGG